MKSFNKIGLNKISKVDIKSVDILMVLVVISLGLFNCGCNSAKVDLSGKDAKLTSIATTEGSYEVEYPDAPPSVADGKIMWDKLNCASCHGDTGVGVSGQCSVDLTDKKLMRKQEPVNQYLLLAFGKANAYPGVSHPNYLTKATTRQIWDTVFYARNLAVPALTDAQAMDIDSVFGSNCAVCHGKKGYGDGPLSKNLDPVPANFQQYNRFYHRTDDVLWDHIANGITWEGMPNFLHKQDKSKNVVFDDEYIWKLVQYIRHFQETTEKTISVDTTNSTTINNGG